MKTDITDRRIAQLHEQIAANVREIVRLDSVIEDETRQILDLCGIDARLMNLEFQAAASYQGVSHGAE